MKKNKIIICFLILTLVFTSFINTNFAINLNKNNVNNEKPINDLQEIKAYEMDKSDLEKLLGDDQNTYTAANFNAYSLNNYGSTYGFEMLDGSADARNAYRAMLRSATNFQFSNTDATLSNNKYKTGLVNLSSYNLTRDQVFKIFLAMLYDNPQIYFTSTIYFYFNDSGSKISYVAFGCAEEYASGTVRQDLNSKIDVTIRSFLDSVTRYKSDAEKEMMLHNLLVANLNYAWDSTGQPETSSFAHNIVGAFDREHWSVVCEGYAKAFQLLLNASGIECIFVGGIAYVSENNSGAHAWNQVKLDGKWYNVDVTWDDNGDDYIYFNYFNLTDSNFTDTHVAFSSESTTNEWCYNTNSCHSTTYNAQYIKELMDSNVDLKKISYNNDSEDIIIGVLNNGLEVPPETSVYKGTKLKVLILAKSDNLMSTHYLNVNDIEFKFSRNSDYTTDEYYAYLSNYEYTVGDEDLRFEVISKDIIDNINIELNKTEYTFSNKSETYKLVATYRGAVIDPSKLTFVNDNPYSVKVAADGTVTANSAGISNITVKYEELGKEASCTFNSNFAFTLGDIDNNNRVSILDAYSLLQFLSLRAGGGRIDSSILNAADFDSNGKVSITDAYLLLKYLSENI